MNRALAIARIIGALCFAVLCLASALTVLQLREMAVAEANNLDLLTQHVVTVTNDVDGTIDDLRGSVRMVPKVIHDTRLTLDNANKAAIDERMYFEQEMPGLMAGVNATVSQSQKTLAAYEATGEALTAATERLQPVEDNAAHSFNALDTLLEDPHWATTLANLNAGAAATASAAQHVDGTTAEIQTGVHAFLHPSWKVRLTNWISQAVHAAGGWF